MASEEQQTGVRIVETKTAGLWIDRGGFASGGGLGIRAERRELIPLDCRVVIRVTDRAELDAVAKLLDAMGGDGQCVVRD